MEDIGLWPDELATIIRVLNERAADLFDRSSYECDDREQYREESSDLESLALRIADRAADWL